MDGYTRGLLWSHQSDQAASSDHCITLRVSVSKRETLHQPIGCSNQTCIIWGMSEVRTFASARVWKVVISHLIKIWDGIALSDAHRRVIFALLERLPFQPQNLPIFSPMTCRRSGTPRSKDNQCQNVPAGQKYSIWENRLTQNINIYIIRKPGMVEGQLTPGGSLGPGHLLEEMINTRKPGWQNDTFTSKDNKHPEARSAR